MAAPSGISLATRGLLPASGLNAATRGLVGGVPSPLGVKSTSRRVEASRSRRYTTGTSRRES
jgi:hypothetical protein